MRVTLKHGLSALAALFILGVVLAWSGFINVAASSGHWMVTDWFLHWVMRNSVRAQAAMTVDEPATDPTGLISAAGHYAVNCAPCHGAPGERRSPVMQAATPPPPDLSLTAGSYSARQLFWVIKHGVKFTPMPAWPAQGRDDEVRRMAAFVQRLPRMRPTEYRALAYGSGHIVGGVTLDTATALADCARCHADGGRGQPDIPMLAGQKAAYLVGSIDAFASGRRSSAVMSSAAARLDPKMIQALAEHYSGLPGLARLPDTPYGVSAAADPLVERIVKHGLPAADLPACSRCHSPGKRPRYPILAGQKAAYLAARLRRWRGEAKVVEARKPRWTMPTIARRIPEAMIDPLAAYFAQQASPHPEPSLPVRDPDAQALHGPEP